MLAHTATYHGRARYWAFMRSNRKEGFGSNRILITGRELHYTASGTRRILENSQGYFGCRKVIDALSMPGTYLCRVEMNDADEYEATGVVAANRKIIAAGKAEHWLHEQSVGWMKETLSHVHANGPDEETHFNVLQKGVELKQAWLKGDETTENLLKYYELIDSSCTGFSCRRNDSNEYWLWYLAGRAVRYGYDFSDMDGRCLVKALPNIVFTAAGYAHALATGEGTSPGSWLREFELNKEIAAAAMNFLKERCRYTEAPEAAAA